jgi:hypothetical protein
MDNKDPEIKKPEEIADSPLPQEELNRVVGGTSSGKHIAKVTVELVRAGGDKIKY